MPEPALPSSWAKEPSTFSLAHPCGGGCHFRVPEASDRTQVEPKEVRLSDMSAITLDDTDVQIKRQSGPRFVDCGLQCGSEHFVCQACVSGGDGNGGNAVSYTLSRFMDGVVDAYKVPCLYKGHGCAMDGIPYHSAADHKASCKHAPCYCFDCRFVGSPAKLVRHLASPSGAHAWPVEKIRK
ncbi:uncharacterized protein [Triticum aestivum]|uniref:uncharacterized protein n=1 Tax=Triticum aestivum TaxID=4565 RepID=UPI001D0182AA|nr:uncharacterized protein LOC123076013 [Triticum aestivum]